METLTRIWFILEVIIGFGLLVFVHELGHFLVAKWVGVRVEKFSLGFGPKLCGFTRGDTEYLISAVPLGGYVKMAGESILEASPENQASSSGKKDEFYQKSVGQRSLIILAGPAMNLVFALPAAVLMFLLGTHQPSTLCDVMPGSPAARAGITDGSRILSVNGVSVKTFPELHTQIMLAPSGTVFDIRVAGNDDPYVVTPGVLNKAVGLTPHKGTTILNTTRGSPAAGAGISRGDRIVSVNGEAVKDWDTFTRLQDAHREKEIRLGLERPKPSRNGYPEYVPYEVELHVGTRREYDLGLELKLTALPIAGQVIRNSAARKAGMKRGDQVIRIDGKPIHTWEEMRAAVNASGGKPVEFRIRRDEEELALPIAPRKMGDAYLIGLKSDWLMARIEKIPAEGGKPPPAGIREGDFIVTINDRPLRYSKEFILVRLFGALQRGIFGRKLIDTTSRIAPSSLPRVIQESKGEPLRLGILRVESDQSSKLSVDVPPQLKSYGAIGVTQGAETVLIKYPLGLAMKKSFSETWKIISVTVESIYRLVTGNIPLNMMGGPVGISTALFYKAREGLAEFIHLLFIISVNLGLINLFPIPILDGGHLALLTAEKLKGRPVREQTMAALQYVGLALLLALVIFATHNDIMNFNLF